MTAVIEPSNTEWVWGKQAVRELLRTNPLQVKQVWLSPSSKDPINREIQELCQKVKIPVAYKDRKTWEEIFRVPAHQSVAAQLKFAFRFTPLGDLLKRIKAAEDPSPVLLMIDHLQDPHNLGAIIRTASGAGVRGIILPKDRTCPISGTVHKTAAGALEYLPLVQVTNLAQTIEVPEKRGFLVSKPGGPGIAEYLSIGFEGASGGGHRERGERGQSINFEEVGLGGLHPHGGQADFVKCLGGLRRGSV